MRLPPPGEPVTREMIGRWLGHIARAPVHETVPEPLAWNPFRSRAVRRWLRAGLLLVGGVLAVAYGAQILQFLAGLVVIALVGLVWVGRIVAPLMPWQSELARSWMSAQISPADAEPASVTAYAGGLWVGGVLVDWWQLKSIEREGTDWRVRWTGGTFGLSGWVRHTPRLVKAISAVLQARRQGSPLPDEPAGQDVPDGAISLARLTGDGEPDRGLSLTEGRDDG